MRPPEILGRLASVPSFFLLRIAAALALLKLSSNFLPVSGFAVFSQFMLFAALLNVLAVGGAQNGLIRQAAAAGDLSTLSKRQTAAFLIWAVVAPLLAVATALFSVPICGVLIGSGHEALAVIAIALLALAGGPGQIWCSVLSGRKKVAQSLTAQALGLLASTGLAAWFIIHGRPTWAVIGFAGGSLASGLASFLFAARLSIPWARPREAFAEVRPLLRYSIALAATTVFSSVVLFGLRFEYREAFGPTVLGYWLAANRISDMSTQLVGLFMIQFFVPHFVALESEPEQRRFILFCWAVGAAAMGSALTLFFLASRPLVHIFLSDAFLPAIPAIRVYMTGDFLRVWVSLAMFVSFARGQPVRYAAIEIATFALMAIIVLALLSAGNVNAPQLGYACAYGLGALIASLAFLWPRLKPRQLSSLPLP